MSQEVTEESRTEGRWPDHGGRGKVADSGQIRKNLEDFKDGVSGF